MMKFTKMTKKQVNELKKKVKAATGYNLNQIDIIAFSDNFIDYDIYKNENSKLLGHKKINEGRISIMLKNYESKKLIGKEISLKGWKVYDCAEFRTEDGEIKIFAIIVNDQTKEAMEAILDGYEWETDFSYPSIEINSFDVAAALNFEGAKKAGYKFVD